MRTKTKIFSVLIVFILIFTAIPFPASARTIDDINADIEKYEQQMASNDKNQKDTKKNLNLLVLVTV